MKFYFLFTSLDTVLISHLCKVCQKKRVFHTMGLKRHFLFSSPFLSARDRYYCDVLRHWVKYLLLSSPVAGVGQSPRGRVAVPLASALPGGGDAGRHLLAAGPLAPHLLALPLHSSHAGTLPSQLPEWSQSMIRDLRRCCVGHPPFRWASVLFFWGCHPFYICMPSVTFYYFVPAGLFFFPLKLSVSTSGWC